MHYILYKTVNRITGEFYIGVHKCEDINDNYFGSGLRIKRSIQKYGRENFARFVLETFETREGAYDAESKAVTSDVIADPLCLNLRLGGDGGWEYVNDTPWDSRANYKTPEQLRMLSVKGTKVAAKLRSERSRLDPEYGRSLTEKANKASASLSSIQKRKATFEHIAHQKGENNSQFGTCWVCNKELQQAKKINKDDLNMWLSQGWQQGRKWQ